MPDNTTWIPPGHDCGLCGERNCRSFLQATRQGNGTLSLSACPYYQETPAPEEAPPPAVAGAAYGGRDVLGHRYDFVLKPLPGEISARKIVLPFRADLVERLGIAEGDHVLGRPMGAGCPVPHVLKVIQADCLTGLLTTWVVGPRQAREGKVHDVNAYHMIGFEGLAAEVVNHPVVGARVTFLPGFCMMHLNHTGLVNMSLAKADGLHLRIEDIRILASYDAT